MTFFIRNKNTNIMTELSYDNEYDKVLDFWFPGENTNDYRFRPEWFDKSIDHEITERFSLLLIKAETGIFNTWLEERKSKFALLILLDQFTRNIHRNGNYTRNDTNALSIALSIIKSNDDTEFYLHERIFIYLPLRHSKQIQYYDILFKKLNDINITLLTRNELNIYNRFYKATIRDYCKLTDIITHQFSLSDIFTPNQNIITDICKSYTHYDNSMEIPLIKIKLYNTLKSYIKKHFKEQPNICISLSGGVDSMVLSYLLKQLEYDKFINKVLAVHIDYGNRTVSENECKFVCDWCKFLGIEVYWVRIKHINRHDARVDTSFYEQQSKNLRFNVYKYVIQKHNICGIILGHHNGDKTENVLMNLLRGKDVLNLNGMKSYQIINNIVISRPLLDCNKDSIYTFAHEYNIPYLKDTTTESCYRGFVRSTIPKIHEHNISSVKNIQLTGNNSSDWNIIFEKLVLQKILSSVIDYKNGFQLYYEEEWKHLPNVFWIKILARIFHQKSISMCTKKNVISFVKWFNKGGNGYYQLSNNICIYSKDSLITFIDCNILYYVKQERSIEIKAKEIIADWSITITSVSNKSRTERITVEDILNGEFHYYLHEVPLSSKQLIITNYIGDDKNLRRYWKGLPSIMSKIPKFKTEIEVGSERTLKIQYQRLTRYLPTT